MSEPLRLWLSKELAQRNLSHNELARKAGLAQSTVSSVLARKRKPGCDFCVKVAIALNITPETLLRLAGILPPGPPANPTDNETLQQLVELARTLPPDKQEEVLRYVQFLSGK